MASEVPIEVGSQEGKLQKKNVAKRARTQIGKFMKNSGKDPEKVIEPASRTDHPRPPKESDAPSKSKPGSTSHKGPTAPNIEIGPNDDREIERLQRVYQDLERGMSSDVNDGRTEESPLPILDMDGFKIEGPAVPNGVMAIAHVPSTSRTLKDLRHRVPIVQNPDYTALPAQVFPMGLGLSAEPKALHADDEAGVDEDSHTKLRDLQHLNDQLRTQLMDRKFTEKRVESIQEEHEKTRQDLHELQGLYEQSRSESTRLECELDELESKASYWQTQFNLANSELLKLQTELSSEVSDKWLQSQWYDLHVKIENLSNQYFVGRISLPSHVWSKPSQPVKLSHQPAVAIAQLTNKSAEYLGSDRERHLIIQAFIWWFLVNKIFAHTRYDDGGFYWAGQSRELLYHLKRQVRLLRPQTWSQLNPNDLKRAEKDSKNYHQWRATTSILLQAGESADKRVRHIQGLITEQIVEMLCVIRPYIVTSKDISTAMAEDDICKQLEAILTQAIKLDAEMAKQRAWIHCEQWWAPIEGDPMWGFRWVAEEAEMIQTSEQIKSRRANFKDPCVQLIVQPALIKEGNQYGQNYATREILCKAKVIVGESAYPASSRR
jgi:hypothetical protein